MRWHRRLAVTLVAGPRLPLLKRTAATLERAIPHALSAAHVVALTHNDNESRRFIESLRFVKHRISVHGSLAPTAAINRVMGVALSADVDYLLHVEDGWEATTATGRWLDDAKQILERDSSIGQVHLRRSVIERGAASSRFTFSPSLMRASDTRRLYPCKDQTEVQHRYRETALSTVQHVPGAFRHLGADHPLRPPRSRSEQNRRVSVIVPCAAKHLGHLPTLMAHLRAQTTKPSEVVIAISACAELPQPLADLFSAQPFPVIACTTARTAYAGKNRNIAADASRGDILIYQDADDIPHPQRVEAILTAFAARPIDHLMHQYAHETSPHHAELRARYGRRFSAEQIRRALRYAPAYSRGDTLLHNGQIASSRAVFQRVRWSDRQRRGQDVDYNQAVYRSLGRNYVLDLPLVTYRQRFTTDPATFKVASSTP